jgi:hypothetical protein
MAKPINLLYAFALRMLLVLLVNGVLWTVAVKYYYRHQTATQILAIVQQELQALEPLIRKYAYTDRLQMAAFLRKTMHEWSIPFLQVYRTGEGMVVNQGAAMLPESLRPFPATLPEQGEPSYQLFQSANANYLYLFAPVFEPGWYMRTAIPVNRDYIAQIESNTHTVQLVVIVTLLQVTLVLFPLLLASYRRILRERDRLLMSNLRTVLALGNAVAKRDSDTDSHNYRVSYYALRLAQAVGLEPKRMPGLIKGAFLHDVGKIGVPDHILLKQGSLNEQEREIVKRHVYDGLEIVAGIAWLSDATSVIGGHHEQFDGSGYPQGLKDEAIPLEARIFSVVDVFDALTSRRPYKEALSVDEALHIMDASEGRHFDPQIYRTFRGLALSLFEQVSGDDRRRLRRTLGHAIQPYFRHLRD